MKSILVSALIFIMSQSAAAHDIVCQSLDESINKTVILRSVDRNLERPIEGEKHAYEIQVFVDDACWADIEEEGIVETEDVMFHFGSNSSDVALSLFMDEPDQSTLYIKGEEPLNMNCEQADDLPEEV